MFRSGDDELHGTIGLGIAMKRVKIDLAADFADTDNEYLVSIIIVSAILVSFSIYILEKEKTIENLKTYAYQNLIDEDIFAEYLINEAVNEVLSDPFISYWMTSPFVSKEIISRKIRQEYLGRYLKKYNIQILLFNQAGSNINESGVSLDYFSLAKRYAVEQNKTDFENVYHVNRLRSNFFKRYQAFIEIKRYAINFKTFNSNRGCISI